MILFFHFLCLLARYIVSNFSKSLSITKSHSADVLKNGSVKESMYENGVLKFFPPVYVQRYETVALILKDAQWKGKIRKLADFGCSELGLFMYLKKIEGLSEILEIDIDKDVLERCSYKAAPLASDFLCCRAVKPLEVYILEGNIAEYDDHLIGTDAVVGIELIEHLSEEDFKRMPHNVFSQIKPKLAIFTTPNADFNPLFPDLKKFRHPDHKFEWTRKEFYQWTQGIIKNYPEYMVKFYGIGAGPEGTENLGCCSQMAVFQKTEISEFFSTTREKSAVKIKNYELIKYYSYPVYVDTRTREQKIVHEIRYQVRYISSLSEYYNYDEGQCEVPLKLVENYVDELCPDEEELIEILKNNGIKMKCVNGSWSIIPTESDSSSSDEGLTSDRDSSIDETDKNNGIGDKLHLDEGWDFEDDTANFQSARSLEDFNEESGGDRVHTTKCKVPSDGVYKEDAISGSISCSPIIRRFDSNSVHSSTSRSKDSEGKRVVCKSKIPRKKKLRETEECSPRVKQSMSASYVRKPFGKFSKSCSLDSGLENISSWELESDRMAYLNLISWGSAPFRKIRSSSSSSSVLSNSLDKAVDSWYLRSFSPPCFDLTTENVTRSSSLSSEDGHGVEFENQ